MLSGCSSRLIRKLTGLIFKLETPSWAFQIPWTSPQTLRYVARATVLHARVLYKGTRKECIVIGELHINYAGSLGLTSFARTFDTRVRLIFFCNVWAVDQALETCHCRFFECELRLGCRRKMVWHWQRSSGFIWFRHFRPNTALHNHLQHIRDDDSVQWDQCSKDSRSAKRLHWNFEQPHFLDYLGINVYSTGEACFFFFFSLVS